MKILRYKTKHLDAYHQYKNIDTILMMNLRAINYKKIKFIWELLDVFCKFLIHGYLIKMQN